MKTGTIVATLDTRSRRAADTPGSPLRFVASTEEVARDGGILRADGWRLDNYRKSPIVSWSHDLTAPPIGKAEVEVRDRKLLATVTFDSAGDDFAREIEGKFRRGFLTSLSVGWETKRLAGAETVKPPGAEWVSLEHELLDIAAVTVPSDTNAVMLRALRARRRVPKAAPSETEVMLLKIIDALDAKIIAADNAANRAALQLDLRELAHRLGVSL